MDTKQILAELRAERSRLETAINALEQIGVGIAPVRVGRPAAGPEAGPKRRRTMSAAARKRISEAAKARWAARKQGANAPKKSVAKKAAPARRRF